MTFLWKDWLDFSVTLSDKTTHCGVLEFIAEEGQVNAPSWILDVLMAKVGDLVDVRTTNDNFT